MAFEAEIVGSEQLKKLAAEIRARGEAGVGREMGAALRKAANPVQKQIQRQYETLPAGGGYAALFSKSLRFRTSLRTSAKTASFRLLTYADGAGERRDIQALEGGKLRHPVFGRSRGGRKGERLANPWAVTSVKGGFHRRGTDQAADDVEKQMVDVLAEYAHKLING